MRTTLLVCLAAAIAMIQANVLMGMRGKTSDSFVVLDLMRLPLGILSGMGFIGAGAILRKGNMVLGVTTAATLWFTTVMGLCFGGGQIGLGAAALALALLTLWGLKAVEERMPTEREATLSITASASLTDAEIRLAVAQAQCEIIAWAVRYAAGGARRTIQCQVQRRMRGRAMELPPPLEALARRADTEALEWTPRGAGGNGEN